MTIHVLAELQPREGALDEVKSLLIQAVPAVTAEPGCLQYLVLEGRGTLVLEEEWEDSDALTAHAKGEAFKTLAAGLDGKLNQPMTVRQLRRVAG